MTLDLPAKCNILAPSPISHVHFQAGTFPFFHISTVGHHLIAWYPTIILSITSVTIRHSSCAIHTKCTHLTITAFLCLWLLTLHLASNIIFFQIAITHISTALHHATVIHPSHHSFKSFSSIICLFPLTTAFVKIAVPTSTFIHLFTILSYNLASSKSAIQHQHLA